MAKPRSAVFVGEIGEEFLCVICHDVLEVPVSCTQGHTFCEGCLDRWMASSKSCPTCKVELNKSFLTRNRPLETLIEKLPVHCENIQEADNPTDTSSASNTKPKGGRKRKLVDVSLDASAAEAKEEGCRWTGKYGDLRKHLSDDCPFAIVRCSNKGCEMAGIQRRSLAAHIAVCDYRLVKCEFCHQLQRFCSLDAHKEACNMAPVVCICGTSICRGKLAFHKATSCPQGIVTCPFARFGCSVKDLKRCNYEKHQAEAALRHSELLTSRLAALEAAVAKQEGDHKVMVAALEATVARHVDDRKAEVESLQASAAK